ncbi:ATP-dependent nuclease [Corynebacterium variabile]|nr:ATP-binding protein [Corynebacterium variabile]
MTNRNLTEGNRVLKLRKVSVRKYRSIDRQASFDVGNFSVLIGPNNQGKSNLLRATALGMAIIRGWSRIAPGRSALREPPISYVLSVSRRGIPSHSHGADIEYYWDRDFPVFARQRKGAQTSTIIQLDFALSASERDEFKSSTGISINDNLPIKITLGEMKVKLEVPKQGKGNHDLKSRAIARFVDKHISMLYIPAIRTNLTAIDIAQEILTSRRRKLQEDEEYNQLLEKIQSYHDSIDSDVEEILKRTLDRFVPGTLAVDLKTKSVASSWEIEDISIDDGSLTSLTSKGDGIQSLVALALTLEWTRSRNHPDRQLIIAVEEPESHLHPGAIHELRSVLSGISEDHQVMVTTHSQSLVNRNSIGQNVIVSDRTAHPARNIEDLRKILGVEVSDSLTSAEVMIILEGKLDYLTLPKILGLKEPRVRELIKSGRITFMAAGSGSKISTLVAAANAILAKPIAIVDGDSAGKSDVKKLLESGKINNTSVVSIARPNSKYSELEDLFKDSIYMESVESVIGFSLNEKQKSTLANGQTQAWSERLQRILEDCGVPDAEKTVAKAKSVVADRVSASVDRGENVIREECSQIIDRMAEMIVRSTPER